MGKRRDRTVPNGSKRIDEVVEIIARAFEAVQRHDGITLHEADVIDSYGTERERASARRKDVDTCWQEVPAADIERYYGILNFVDTEGFRYYLPAYMTWSLRNYRRTRSMTIDSTIYALSLSEDADINRWKRERFSLLTSEQKRAACAFLRYMAYESEGRADCKVALAALETFWNKFL